MDGLAEMAGGSLPPFEWDGTAWQFGVLKARDWAEIERKVSEVRPSPARMLGDVAEYAARMPDTFLRRFAELVYNDLRKGNIVTREEVRDYLETVSGEQYKTYLSLRINHPGVTLERAAEVLDALNERLSTAAARRALQEVEGLPEANPSSPGAETMASPSPGEPSS